MSKCTCCWYRPTAVYDTVIYTDCQHRTRCFLAANPPFLSSPSVSAAFFFFFFPRRDAQHFSRSEIHLFFIAPCVDCKIRSHGGHQIFTAAVRPWNWIQAVCVEMCKKKKKKNILSLVFMSALPLSCFFFFYSVIYLFLNYWIFTQSSYSDAACPVLKLYTREFLYFLSIFLKKTSSARRPSLRESCCFWGLF